MPESKSQTTPATPADQLTDLFERYRALAASVDQVFETVRQQHPNEVTCHQGCSDCCHAVFDLSMAEALYVNAMFNQAVETGAMDQTRRSAILDRADTAEREQARMARDASKESRQGMQDEELLAKVAARRVRCPLLSENDVCEMYDHRPLTCRLYGVPQNIGGKGHVCGRTNFDKGGTYPTVAVDKIQDALVELSLLMGDRLGSTFGGFATTHMPLASALLTAFNQDYFGKKKSLTDELTDELPDELPGEQTPGANPQNNPFTPLSKARKSVAESGCTPDDCASCGSTNCGGESSSGCSGDPTIITFGGHQAPDAED